MKTPAKQFADWEGDVFGFGYGTGEAHTVGALKAFLAACPATGNYDYKALERTLTPTIAWLLINWLCHANIIDYGTSPRFGWLSPSGQALKKFTDAHTIDELVEFTNDNEDPCYPDACNCGPNGYEPGRKCTNAFWGAYPPEST